MVLGSDGIHVDFPKARSEHLLGALIQSSTLYSAYIQQSCCTVHELVVILTVIMYSYKKASKRKAFHWQLMLCVFISVQAYCHCKASLSENSMPKNINKLGLLGLLILRLTPVT